MIRWARGFCFALAAAACAGNAPAYADEALFGYVTTTDSLPKDRLEYQQWATLRSGRAGGSYRVVDLRSGIGKGVTNAFQTTFYLNTSYRYIRDVSDPASAGRNLRNQNGFGINGGSLEMKYRWLSPYKDPLGLSFLLEPAISGRDADRGRERTGAALQVRLIGQKNYWEDQGVFAVNLSVAPQWQDQTRPSENPMTAEAVVGTSYRFARNWFAGLEARNRREFAGPGFGRETYSAYFAGPALHYGGRKWWMTLAAMPQISGRPSEPGGSRYLGKQERLEVRLKVGFNFSEVL
jgi:hypothetical protein